MKLHPSVQQGRNKLAKMQQIKQTGFLSASMLPESTMLSEFDFYRTQLTVMQQCRRIHRGKGRAPRFTKNFGTNRKQRAKFF